MSERFRMATKPSARATDWQPNRHPEAGEDTDVIGDPPLLGDQIMLPLA